VLYAEPNYIVRKAASPNDAYYSLLYGLTNIKAPSAWDVTTGGTSAVIGVIDTGVDYSHPDLAANIWSAPTPFTVTVGGVAVNCPAGSHGFNAITKVCDPSDDHNHGTHVSGTIGAEGNNGIGITGVNWTARIMGLKFLDASGIGTIADAVSAIEFAIQVKALFTGTATPVDVRVLSNSWVGTGYSQALLDAINLANASGMLFVAAAGNSAADTEVSAFYPANYTAPNVLTVAATDSADALASFSNFGAATVHLGAPGVNTYSTVRSGGYAYFSGTSMATPHVAGAALLTLAACPSLKPEDLKRLALNTTDPDSFLTGKTISGGRLNVAQMVKGCRAGSVVPASGWGNSATFTFTVSDPDGASDIVSAQMLFNTALSATDACYVYFSRGSNQVWLRDPTNTTWLGPATLGAAANLSNSHCSIHAANSSSSSAGNDLTVNLELAFLPGFAGAKTSFLSMYDSGAGSGWQTVGSWTVSGGTNQPPSSLSVRAASGGGLSRVFSYTASDPNGGGDISATHMLISSSLSGTNGCWMYFLPRSKQLWLRDSANTSWLGPVMLGVSAPLTNGLCTVYAGASSSWSSGDGLTVNVSLTFLPEFGGTKSNYFLAIDSAGQSTNWQTVGTWTVNVPPQPISVTPSAGSGLSQTFTYLISDPNGATDIVSSGFLINGTLSFTNACYLFFFRSTNQLYLLNDSNTAYLGPVRLGTAGTVSNSQCSVNGGGSSLSTAGNDLTVNVALTFSAAFAGVKFQYMKAADTVGGDSDFRFVGTWTVPAASQSSPVAVSVTPSSGSGTGQTFSYVASDANGAADIVATHILINDGLSGTNGCWIYFARATNQVWLRDDVNTSWMGPMTLGSATSLTNSQCTVNVAASSASTSGNNLTLNMALTFKSGFVGLKSHFLFTSDTAGGSSNWQFLGTYTVVSGSPQALSVTPSSGSGLTQTFNYTFSDPNGAADIASTAMLVGATLSAANGCYMFFAGNNLWLANDAGSAWLSPVTLGVIGTTQNAQCIVDAGASSSSSSGNNLTVNVNLTFKASFAGSKTNFMFVIDRAGLSSSWQSRGTWNVP